MRGLVPKSIPPVRVRNPSPTGVRRGAACHGQALTCVSSGLAEADRLDEEHGSAAGPTPRAHGSAAGPTPRAHASLPSAGARRGASDNRHVDYD